MTRTIKKNFIMDGIIYLQNVPMDRKPSTVEINQSVLDNKLLIAKLMNDLLYVINTSGNKLYSAL